MGKKDKTRGVIGTINGDVTGTIIQAGAITGPINLGTGNQINGGPVFSGNNARIAFTDGDSTDDREQNL